jgi:hypothetical protein
MANEIGARDWELYPLFVAWVEEGKKLAERFRNNSIPVPPTLEGFASPTAAQASTPKAIAPERPSAPDRADSDWVWIKPKEASSQTLLLAVLNQFGPVEPKAIIDKVRQISGQEISQGTVYNVGHRFSGKKIHKDEGGWSITAGQAAPIIFGSNVWAPPSMLSVQEIAAFRRMAIEHLIRKSLGGLKRIAIVNFLKSADWIKQRKVPVSKDLIKADLVSMETDGRIKKDPSTGHWILTEGNAG